MAAEATLESRGAWDAVFAQCFAAVVPLLYHCVANREAPALITERRTSSAPTQASQFTSEAFTGVLKDHGIAISMDGKGCWVDNVFVERLWRSVKYADVYLRAYETPAELRKGLARYFEFYNTRRRHSTLDRRTPDAVCFDQATHKLAA